MNDSSAPLSRELRRRIAILGGGISGLTAAWELGRRCPDWKIDLFEQRDRVGGVLQTTESEGYLLESSADTFITRLPWCVELCHELGIADELIPTNESNRRALVSRGNELYPVPPGFVLISPRSVWPVLTSPVLSVWGKCRLLMELISCRRLRRREGSEQQSGEALPDESVTSFVTRHFGEEVLQRLVQPLLAGIYTADPARLSMAATMPQFLRLEREYGSLIRAALAGAAFDDQTANLSAERNESGARYGLFVTPHQGMGAIVDALAEKLPSGVLHLDSRVECLLPHNDGYRVQLAGEPQARDYDGVIVALPAPIAAQVVRPIDTELTAALQKIEYASSAIVVLGYEQGQIGRELDGFGVVVPACEGRQIIAASFSSVKLPDRAPSGKELIRVFVGGALQPKLAELSDPELLDICKRELRTLIGVEGDPELVRIVRWPNSMPQYHVGHLELVAQIESLASSHQGLALAGNAYRGVGVPQCVLSGRRAAQQIASAYSGDVAI